MKTSLQPRKRPHQARAVATVEAILEAASQVLVARGHAGMTTTRVAEAAGVSVGSLYQYYPSKDALLVALLDRKLTATMAAIHAAVDRTHAHPIADRIRAIIEALFAVKSADPALTIALADCPPHLGGKQLLHGQLRPIATLLRKLLHEHRGEVSVVDPDVTAWVMLHSVNGIVDAATLEPARLRSRATREAAVHLVCAYLGVSSEVSS